PALATLTGFVLLGGLLWALHGAFRTDDFDAVLGRLRQARTLDRKDLADQIDADSVEGHPLVADYRRAAAAHGLGDLDRQAAADAVLARLNAPLNYKDEEVAEALDRLEA